MAPRKGNTSTLTWDGLAYLGIREKSVSFNGEPINVTSDEDNGWQTLLNEPGEKAIEIAVSGVAKTPKMKNDWMSGNRRKPVVYTWPDGSKVEGNFVLTAYSEGDPYNEAATFEATLSSDGQPNFTPGA